MANQERNDGPEQYGGKVAELTDAMNRALNYRGRFGADENRDPKNAQRQIEVDRAQGGK
jgi:hypothetical protein